MRPRKGLGQHFLASPGVLDKIAAAADLTPDDTVLEIGPGLGDLTTRLATRAGRVVAVELDPRLQGPLQAVTRAHPHVEVVFGDILEQDPAALVGGRPYVVVANLPYYITAAVVRHLLAGPHRPQRMVLLVQREVAERMTAQPPRMSLLTLQTQLHGEPRLLFRVPAGAFVPRPKVESAVVRIDARPEPRIPPEQEALFWRVARAAFAQKRKQLRNTLAAGLGLDKTAVEDWLRAAGVDPTRRAETLTWDEWARLLAHAPAALTQA
ncbi:MAG: ribosomal RNA small subunit methyltransferase A [Chloroflexi bacterium]|nr:ribosomal RNA small subunit methyltransferase A [Chloroflexota bacterium]